MILHVVLKSKEELSTLKTISNKPFGNIQFEDSFIFMKLQFIRNQCAMGYTVSDAPKSPILSIEELQHWLLLVSMSWSPEEALTQITGGT
mgnify:FL=1